MSEKKLLFINVVWFVYGDEIIVVQCVLWKVVKGRIFIKVYSDCWVVVFVLFGMLVQDVFFVLKK